MNYEQFVCAMLECAKSKLPENCLVDRQEVLKNNGVLMVGLSLREKGKEIAPVIYLDEYYKRYLQGDTIDCLTDSLIRKIRSAPEAPLWSSEQFLDFHQMKDKIVYKLINAKENEKLLKEVPNLPVLDFAIVFYLHLPISETESGSVLIRNAHMNLWKRPVSVLYSYAKENTPRIYPYLFCRLSDFLEQHGEYLPEECPIFVLTNEMGVNGASVLLYPEVTKCIYETLGDHYYLLPSSIHEFLVIPEGDGADPSQLRSIVREVNRTEIEKEDLLSDQIYYFDGDIITKM